MVKKQSVHTDQAFKFWMADLAMMNSFLKTHIGDAAAEKFFDFLINQHRKDLLRKYPKLSLEEFAEVYSLQLQEFQQFHMELTPDNNTSSEDSIPLEVENSKNKNEITFFVFDCTPYKVINSAMPIPSIMASDFPCRIWCQKMVPLFATTYGLEASMTKKKDGCYCQIKEKSLPKKNDTAAP